MIKKLLDTFRAILKSDAIVAVIVFSVQSDISSANEWRLFDDVYSI